MQSIICVSSIFKKLPKLPPESRNEGRGGRRNNRGRNRRDHDSQKADNQKAEDTGAEEIKADTPAEPKEVETAEAATSEDPPKRRRKAPARNKESDNVAEATETIEAAE